MFQPALGRVPPWFLSFLIFAAFSAIELRAGFGGAGMLPAGTNAGDYYLSSWFLSHNPIGTWLYPYTDWGQPYPGFTGPTVLTPAIVVLNQTILVRGIEFVSYIGAGAGVYWVVRKAGGTWTGATVGGFYYMVMVQSGQFTEAHIGAMISLALAPPFLFVLYGLVVRPSVRSAVLAAILLYLLVSIGDLGILYFMLFFAILLTGFALIWRWRERAYRRQDLVPLFVGSGVFVLLILSWLVPFLYGARPQFTTGINVSIVPFPETAGTNLAFAFVGFYPDNSYMLFTYHIRYSWFGGLGLIPLFAVIPIIIGFYAFATKRLPIVVFYLSGLLAVVFASGKGLPGISAFNAWMYNHVPFFDSLPQVFRWTVYAVLVYALLLGKLLSDVERDLADGGPWVRHGWERWKGYFHRLARQPVARGSRGGPGSDAPRPGQGAERWARSSRHRGPSLLLGSAVAVATIVMVQNAVVIALPPGVYAIPPQYTTAYGYLNQQVLVGSQLMIPFSGIYERTPWCGVCVSGPSQAAAFTGADTATFQAGTPYSLALDQFVGDGLTYGYSRNMTRFLASVNVQYVVATHYANWTYVSSAIYPPAESYNALGNQTGLGPPVFSGGNQQAYRITGPVGNVSFQRTYYIYFGAPSFLYQVLDQPWYNGTNSALIDGSTLSGNQTLFVEHASALLVSTESFLQIPTTIWVAATTFNIPVYLYGPGPPATAVSTLRFSTPVTTEYPCIAPALPAPLTVLNPKVEMTRMNGYELLSPQSGTNSSRPGTVGTPGGPGLGPDIAESATNRQAAPYSGAGALAAGSRSQAAAGMPLSMNTEKYRLAPSETEGRSASGDPGGPVAGEETVNPGIYCVLDSRTSGSTRTPASLPVDSYFGPQPVATDIGFRSSVAGWGVLVLSQTFSNLWQATGPTNAEGRAVANVGLSAWLVNATPGASWHLVYEAQTILQQTLIVQGGLGIGIAAVPIAVWVRRRGGALKSVALHGGTS